MKKILCIGIVGLMAGAASANLILNGDFETPGGSGVVNTINTNPTTGVPGWVWDGLENAPVRATDATYNSSTDNFALGHGRDTGAMFQTTGEAVVLDKDYSMTVNVFNTYVAHGGAVLTRLYYLDGSTREYIAGAEATHESTTQKEGGAPGSLQIDYTGSGAAVGKLLGVEFSWQNGTGNGSWIGVDNVAINAVPEPATLGLVCMVSGGLLFVRRRFCM